MFFKSYVTRSAILLVLLVTLQFCLVYLIAPLCPNPTVAAVLFFVLMLGLSVGMVILNQRILIKPLRKINDAAEKVAKGEFGVRIRATDFDNDIKATSISFNALANQFENLEQMRKQFVANASHELRSPLTSMQGFLQAILDGTISDQDRNKYLNIVFSETKRLSTMIQSMLDLSRLESGKNPIVPTRFEINELIRRVVIRFEPSLVKKEIALDVDFIREQCYVYADKDKIEQVLVNLIDNAIKYSPILTRILVTTHIHAKKIYVSVKDRGVGIGKKDQTLIWDRFYMSDRARTPGIGKGTGLGLSIVKKIIDDHREVIWVESNRGAGSTFIFTLPIFDPTRHKPQAPQQLLSAPPPVRVPEKRPPTH